MLLYWGKEYMLKVRQRNNPADDLVLSGHLLLGNNIFVYTRVTCFYETREGTWKAATTTHAYFISGHDHDRLAQQFVPPGSITSPEMTKSTMLLQQKGCMIYSRTSWVPQLHLIFNVSIIVAAAWAVTSAKFIFGVGNVIESSKAMVGLGTSCISNNNNCSVLALVSESFLILCLVLPTFAALFT